MEDKPTPAEYWMRSPISGGSAAVVVPLVAALLPLLPGLVQSVTAIVREIQTHALTPDQAKAQLEQVLTHLDAAAAAVAAVQV